MPPVNLGFYTLLSTDWWLVLPGLSLVAVTLFFPKDIGRIIAGLRDEGGTAIALVERFVGPAFGLADEIVAPNRGDVVLRSPGEGLSREVLLSRVSI